MAAPLRTAVAAASTGFVPRTVFEVSPSITRSYFLGHHAGALASMRKVLSNVGLVLECRDSRVPLTSANPLLEAALAGRDRIVVYTKADLCAPASANRWVEKQQRLLTEFHDAAAITTATARESGAGAGAGRTQVVFADERSPRLMGQLLEAIKARAAAAESLTGVQALVVGMPNAGKSTLLNALRRVGMRLPKAARTGAQPGVTRKLSTPVRVIPEDVPGGIDQGVFVIDTPGVFVPYVGDVEAMLKLSLVGCVKDGLVPAETVADYLLFRLNRRDPALYAELSAPTNDALEFLDAVALRTGKLLRGGVPSREQAADWVVQQWRKGNLGRFGLDDVSEESLRASRARALAGDDQQPLSMSQAKKREKETRKERNAAKRQAAEGA
ncbi:P-loop containing nucleoside triphosphate hydrolase protein [Hypoxylon rubiginosum]|uniref:P-loop containing nucleoside triphosphate hydrolase protein n=1 Tax=Hypoxylon rubiginosum TaxID=110542 RepID=A0ACB9Z573_9PEZI|nr:P-loop containing nucleoside triphosphate hydrolase protein [Hypoxylon rubiginosum]